MPDRRGRLRQPTSLAPITGLAIAVMLGLGLYVSIELIWQPNTLVSRPHKGG